MQDKEKTTFGTPKSNFEFNLMPFGLTNATAMVQSVMECVLGGLTEKECLIYLDNIVVFSKFLKGHIES